jgi:hypothetical protein
MAIDYSNLAKHPELYVDISNLAKDIGDAAFNLSNLAAIQAAYDIAAEPPLTVVPTPAGPLSVVDPAAGVPLPAPLPQPPAPVAPAPVPAPVNLMPAPAPVVVPEPAPVVPQP